MTEEWEYRTVVEGWKYSPENTFREASMWNTRGSAEQSFKWQHDRIGEHVAFAFQPHITAVTLECRTKPGEPFTVQEAHA